MDLEIKIVKNNDALKLLEDDLFVSKWGKLASQQVNVTVQQEHPFVSTWYKQYLNEFNPILILGFDSNAKLIGIIPLAQNKKNYQINHAGDIQAEYCGWICNEPFCETFITQTILLIKNHFNLKKWEWGWIPPKSSIEWFSSDTFKNENIFIKYREFDSPMLDVTDDVKISKLKKNRSLKTKINRYKKKGGFFLERITSKEKAIEIFDILEKQSDFRQMAINQVSPFSDDPNKSSYYINKLDFPDDCHFTVLWSNNKPIAYNFGECDSTTVYLGVTSFDPTESKNSPGKIHLIMLAELMKEEGYRYLDLTPGNDGYKEWFSNSRQKLYFLTLFFNKNDYIIDKIKDSIILNLTKVFNKVNLNPKAILSTINSSPINQVKKFGAGLYKKETYIYYKLNLDDINTEVITESTLVQKNNFTDLLLYDEENKKNKKTTILSNALRSFSLDDILFSIVKNNQLIQYGWMTTKLKNQNNPKIDNFFYFPQKSAILYDFFSTQESLSLCINKMINECLKKEITEVFIGSIDSNPQFIKKIEKIGFQPYQKLIKTSYLWNVKNNIFKFD